MSSTGGDARMQRRMTLAFLMTVTLDRARLLSNLETALSKLAELAPVDLATDAASPYYRAVVAMRVQAALECARTQPHFFKALRDKQFSGGADAAQFPGFVPTGGVGGHSPSAMATAAAADAATKKTTSERLATELGSYYAVRRARECNINVRESVTL
jgi:hypothetical protein